MTNLAKVTKGMMSYFIGFFVSIILYYLIPALIDGLINTDHQAITTMGMILIWIICMLIIPAAMIVQGLREEEEQGASIMGVSAGVLYFIFVIAITIFGWFMINGLASVIEDQLLTVIFWLGLIVNWVLTAIGAPYMKIIHNTKNY